MHSCRHLFPAEFIGVIINRGVRLPFKIYDFICTQAKFTGRTGCVQRHREQGTYRPHVYTNYLIDRRFECSLFPGSRRIGERIVFVGIVEFGPRVPSWFC